MTKFMIDGATAVAADPFGRVTGLWRVERLDVSRPEAGPVEVDLVQVVDRSGSMWAEIANVKSVLTRLLGVHEAIGKTSVTLSLVSYSNDGDCVTHFSHVEMSHAGCDAIVAEGIESLKASGLTGMSQGLRAAERLARPGRVLYVMLMSDGCCNDPGVRSEQDLSEESTRRIASSGGVVSTVSYGAYADFSFLSKLAAAGGGACYTADNAATLYKAMESGASTAASMRASCLRIQAGAGQLVVALLPDASVVAAAATDLVVRGGLPGGTQVWRLSRGLREASSGEDGPLDEARMKSVMASVLAARAALTVGDVDLAKKFVVGSRHRVARAHWRSLTSAEQRDLAAALDEAIAAGEAGVVMDEQLAVVPPGPSVLDVASLMEGFGRGSFKVHLPSLRAAYRRRTVGRLPGRRVADGSVEPFPYRVDPLESTWADVTSTIFSRTRPNASLQTEVPARLVERSPKTVSVGDVLQVTRDPRLLKLWASDSNCLMREAFPDAVRVLATGQDTVQVATTTGTLGWLPLEYVERVVSRAGNVDLEGHLRQVKNYTVVGDGSVVVPYVKLKVTDRRARAALRNLGIDVDDSTWEAEVRFDKMAVTTSDPGGCLPTVSEMGRVLRAAALSRLLSSVKVAGESAKLDRDSVAALQAVGLTPSMNFSPPTVAPYEDVRKALSEGRLDTAVSYEVYVGTPALPLFFKDLYGGSEFLARRFTATTETANGRAEVEKLTGSLLLEGSRVNFAPKRLSNRVKLNGADDAAWLVNCAVLGLHDEPGAREALEDAFAFAFDGRGREINDAMAATTRVRGRVADKSVAAGELDEIRRALDAAVTRFWVTRVSPAVMYAGATGCLPPSAQAVRIDPASVDGVPSSVKTDGAFWRTSGGLLVTVVADQVLVPTARTPRDVVEAASQD